MLEDGYPPQTLHAGVQRGSDNLIKMARDRPEAVYASSKGERTLRQVLSDAATNMDACGPDIAKKLDRAVSTLP